MDPSRPLNPGKNCHYCQHHGGLTPAGHVFCAKNRMVVGQPMEGCCDFQREPGSDDDLNIRQLPNILPKTRLCGS